MFIECAKTQSDQYSRASAPQHDSAEVLVATNQLETNLADISTDVSKLKDLLAQLADHVGVATQQSLPVALEAGHSQDSVVRHHKRPYGSFLFVSRPGGAQRIRPTRPPPTLPNPPNHPKPLENH